MGWLAWVCMATAAASAEPSGLPIEEQVAAYDFEGSDLPEVVNRALAGFGPGSLALNGESSLLVDTRDKEGEWFTFLTTPQGLLEPNARYFLSFEYQIHHRDDDAHFYCYVQSPTEREKNRWGWKSYFTWKGEPGERGVQTKKIVLPNYPDYELYIGVHNGACIVIDNVTIQRLRPWDKNTVLAQAEPVETEGPWEPIGMCTHPGMPWVYTDDEQARTAMRMLGEAGCQWVRIGAGWSILEPEEGQLREDILHRVDVALDEVERQGMHAYIQLLGAPRWASTNPEHERYWAFAPRDLSQWRRHVRQMAEHFRGRTSHWEVWNEMDWEFWESPLEDFVPLLKAAYEELKAVDPACRVVLGGLSTDGVRPWDNPKADANALQRLYDAGVRPYFDILSIHPYAFDVATGAWEAIDKINTAYSIMARNGDGAKPIWVTEWGVSTNLNESSGFAVSLEEQAALLQDAFTILPLHPRVEKVFWYNFRCIGTDPKDQQHQFGIVDFDFTPRPAYQALQALPKPAHRRTAPILLEMDPIP